MPPVDPVSTTTPIDAAADATPASCKTADLGPATSGKIMMVDDEEFNILILRRHLREAGFNTFVTTTESPDTIKLMRQERPSILLLDIMMPKMNGLEVLEKIRKTPSLRLTPVIVLTASNDSSIKLQALEMGVTDFLAKPVDASELILRVRNALTMKAYHDCLANHSNEMERLVRFRTAELEASRREVVHCLARAAESRDSQTGFHILRVGLYAGLIGEQLGFDPKQVAMLQQAAQLHDVGKIAVPDSILLKEGKLTPEEYDLMKTHCEQGRRIIQSDITPDIAAHHRRLSALAGVSYGSTSPLMKLASSIAAAHHEKWDGTGYPNGLRGEEIPIEARITAVADVFDALTSRRPYKEAFPVEDALNILERDRGSHFDPQAVDAFFIRLDEVEQIRTTCADE